MIASDTPSALYPLEMRHPGAHNRRARYAIDRIESNPNVDWIATEERPKGGSKLAVPDSPMSIFATHDVKLPQMDLGAAQSARHPACTARLTRLTVARPVR